MSDKFGIIYIVLIQKLLLSVHSELKIISKNGQSFFSDHAQFNCTISGVFTENCMEI